MLVIHDVCNMYAPQSSAEILKRMSVIRATVATLLHNSHLSMERQWGPVLEVRSKFWCRVRSTGLVFKTHGEQMAVQGGAIDMFSQTVGWVVSPKDFVNNNITILNFC